MERVEAQNPVQQIMLQVIGEFVEENQEEIISRTEAKIAELALEEREEVLSE